MAASTNLVDDVKSAFQSCLALLMNQEQCSIDSDADETKNNVEQAVPKFLDAMKQLDCFFMQKRLLFTVTKPELCVNNDLSDLEQELQRKDAVLQKHHDRVQQLISKMSGGGTTLGGVGTTQPQQTPPGHLAGAHPPQASPQGGVGGAPPPQGMGTQGGQLQGGVGIPGAGGAVGFNQGPLAYLEQTTSNIGQSRAST